MARAARAVLVAAPLLALATLPVRGDSLAEALDRAYHSNPDLAASRAAVRGADARVANAWSGYLPTLKGSVEYQRQRGKEELDFGGETDSLLEEVEDLDADTTTYTLTLSQNLFQGGGTRAAIQGARSRAQSSRADLTVTEGNVLLDAATAYVHVWRDRHAVTEAERNLAGLQERLRRTRRMFDLGEVTLTDVKQAEARLARGQAEADQERANLADSEANYVKVVGPVPAEVDQPTTLPEIPESIADALDRARHAPEIRRATHDVDAARRDVDAATASYFPSLDLTGQLNRQDDPNVFTTETKSASIGVKLTVPFFEGGTTRAQVRENSATLAQRRSELLGQARQVEEGVQNAWDQLRVARSQVRSYGAEVAANELALQGVEREAQVGRRTTLDILDAQQDLFRSRLDALRAEADLAVATFSVKRSIGELTAENLGLVTAGDTPPAPKVPALRRLFGLDEVLD